MCALQGGLRPPRDNASSSVDYQPVRQSSESNMELSTDNKSKKEVSSKSRNCSTSHEDVTCSYEPSRPYVERRMSLPQVFPLAKHSPICSLSNSCIGSRRKVKIEEIAPCSTTIIDEEATWRPCLQTFSSKKQEINKSLSKNVRRYYKEQNELIRCFEEMHLEVDDAMENAKEVLDMRKRADILAKITFGINLLLLIGKVVASCLSGSLSVVSSAIDSAVDLASGALMWWSSRVMKKRDIYSYPGGRTKLEPIAIVILSVVMALASVQMIRESIEKIINYATKDSSTLNIDIATIIILVLTIIIKLILFLTCRRVPVPTTQALAEDHRNDTLSNSVALICGYIGYKWWSYTDPIGAILISFYIIVSWSITGNEQIKMLTGHTARPDIMKKITWIALNHDPSILLIDTVRVYHFGSNFIAEVDIVLPEDMTLKESHDIGESLQHKIEYLPEVERAFVHLDYESEHDPFSEHKRV
ncbi:DgyrCDS4349 [Dimorphilus gyrociliatus]|uniref:DgyrCDS4349 n=1 Tax=Dimorphilus gyrociliatus TaxID=2664684 RepID=A0A7I8VI79_9ANNE|nr:DgyrCDS4349 [Dimorphilus gyrociliatus]